MPGRPARRHMRGGRGMPRGMLAGAGRPPSLDRPSRRWPSALLLLELLLELQTLGFERGLPLLERPAQHARGRRAGRPIRSWGRTALARLGGCVR